MDIRQQLEMVKNQNSQLEAALGTGALAKKSVVAQAIADQLWTDPITGEVYTRYPHTLTHYSSGITLRDGVAGSEVRIFQYQLSDGEEFQFVPNYPQHYIVGRLNTSSGTATVVDDYEARLEGWDPNFRVYRGTIWNGTTTEVNDSDIMRQNGTPLCYNGDKEVRLSGGDQLVFALVTPTSGQTVEITPASSTGSALSFRCFQLTRVRHG
jgi:hypothetical protein